RRCRAIASSTRMWGSGIDWIPSFHILFTRPIQRGNRLRVVSCDLRGMTKNPKMRLLVAASLGALALGAAACGSSDDNSSTSGGSGSSASGTVNGAGSTFAAPVYQQWGSTQKGDGVTLNYQPVGS